MKLASRNDLLSRFAGDGLTPDIFNFAVKKRLFRRIPSTKPDDGTTPLWYADEVIPKIPLAVEFSKAQFKPELLSIVSLMTEALNDENDSYDGTVNAFAAKSSQRLIRAVMQMRPVSETENSNSYDPQSPFLYGWYHHRTHLNALRAWARRVWKYVVAEYGADKPLLGSTAPINTVHKLMKFMQNSEAFATCHREPSGEPKFKIYPVVFDRSAGFTESSVTWTHVVPEYFKALPRRGRPAGKPLSEQGRAKFTHNIRATQEAKRRHMAEQFLKEHPRFAQGDLQALPPPVRATVSVILAERAMEGAK